MSSEITADTFDDWKQAATVEASERRRAHAEIARLRALIMSAAAQIEAGDPNGARTFMLKHVELG